MVYTDGMFYLGTSGFSYDDWVGVFYPLGMPKREWLANYALEFNTCEINSNFYALPKPFVLEAMSEKTSEGFLFSFKVNQEMTHVREDIAPFFMAFCQLLESVIAARKLRCVLAQFPFSFKFNRCNWDHLGLFKKRAGELPVVIEFRNAQWLRKEVFDWFRQYDLEFSCVDELQLPNLLLPLAEATSKIGYVCFHGRNSAKRWQYEHAYQRYDYRYLRDELSEWLHRLRVLDGAAETTFVFANNHWRGQSVDTIRQLRVLLD